ncbi:MAG: hypothetical protein PF961_13745 [Planctomycetota bacterium]|jgi:hypothetical protein|nr:hypothetical protein [Planctomycetota bacterium]
MDQAHPRYWRFALPLVAIGPLWQVSNLAQQAAVLALSGSVRELAAFALARAMVNPFANVLGMVPEMSNVLGRDRSGLLAVRRLVLGIGFALTLCVVAMTLSPAGAALVRGAFSAEAGLVDIVLHYFLWLSLIIPVAGLGQLAAGTLVRAQRTGLVTGIRLGEMCCVLAILVGGGLWGLPVRVVLIASALIPNVLGCCVATVFAHAYLPHDDDPNTVRTTVPTALRFFAPMAATTTMFTLSRPILFAVLSRTTGGGTAAETMIAALSLAFGCGFIFQSVINNVQRHVMATFAAADPAGCLRFSLQLTIATTSVALICLTGPPARWLLSSVMHAEGQVLELATQATAILALAPITIAWRNWYHGLGIAHRKTGAMIIGSLGRNGCVAIGAVSLGALGWLDHRSAAALMVAAFGCEALGTIIASHRWRSAMLGPQAA